MASGPLDIKALVQPMRAHQSVLWAQLPDLELYMDQVITYLNRQLSVYQPAPGEKLMTSAMINNYVKSGLVPRPIKKKYSRAHISRLMMAGSLKQVLPIRQVQQLLDAEQQTEGPFSQKQYDQFCRQQDEALAQAADSITAFLEDKQTLDRPALYQLALQLAIQANASRLLSERLLMALSEDAPAK